MTSKFDREHTKDGNVLTSYTCERCGFVYSKTYDYSPTLCYRCLRYIGKRTFIIMNTIQPSLSRPDREEI